MMKRTIFGIILVGLVSACGDPYTQTIEHDLSFLNKTRSFTARNDSKAYESAYKHFIHYVKTQRDNYGLSPDGFVLVSSLFLKGLLGA